MGVARSGELPLSTSRRNNPNMVREHLSKGRYTNAMTGRMHRFIVGAVTLFVVAALLTHGYPASVFAQAIQPLSMTINISPPLPGPYQTVTATVSSVGPDVNRSLITWKVNGTLAGEGVGATSINFKTGPIGSVTNLEVQSTPLSGISLGAQKSVRPSSVAILWETETYTPPLYRGKALITPGARVILTVVPEIVDSEGNRIAADSLLYKWERNRFPAPEISGFGKYRVVVDNTTFLRPLDFTVMVYTRANELVGRGQITIPISSTMLTLHEDHPLFGIRYENVLVDTYPLVRDEATLLVEPYYYSVLKRGDGSLEYRWRVGTGTPSVRESITFRRVGSEAGRTRIELSVRNLNLLLQTNRVPISISYPPRTPEDTIFSPEASDEPPQF